MKNSITKIAGLVLVAIMVPAMASAVTNDELQAQINALIAQLQMQGGNITAMQYASNAGVNASCTFTKQLSLGMYDPEVTNLQRILNQSEDTQVASYGAGAPGEETDFFGERTRVAVIRFQNKYASSILAPMGLSYGTGAVGVATRAQLHEICAQSGGVVLGASTETPSNNVPTTVVTNSNSNSNTNWNNGNNGNNGNYNNNYGLSGGAGSISAISTSMDVDTEVKQGMTARVLGTKIEAVDSDVAITNVRVVLQNLDNSGSSKRLNRYANRVTIYMNGSSVGSADVLDFSRDGDVYAKSIQLNNAVIRRGSSNKAVFHVVLEANSVIDSNDTASDAWQVQLSEMRYVDATNVTMTSSYAQTKSNINFIKLSSSGDVRLKIASDSSNPSSRNVQVSTSGATRNVPLLAFRLKAEGSALTFNRFNFNVNTSGMTDTVGIIDEYKLMVDGNTLGTVSPVSGTAQSLRLDSDETIGQDSTRIYTLVAQVRKISSGNGSGTTFDQGDAVTASYDSINAEDRNGDSLNGNISGSAFGNTQTFYSEGVQASNFYASYPNATPNQNGKITKQTYNITYRVKAFGNTYYVPKTAVNAALGATDGLSFTVLRGGAIVTSGFATTIGSISSSANTVGNYYEVPDGEERTFTISIDVNATVGGTPGKYSIQLNQVGYANNSSGSIIGAYNFAPAQDYRTAEYTVDAL